MTSIPAAMRWTDALQAARSRNASDVHVAPGAEVVLRVDGRLERVDGVGFSPEETAELASLVLSDEIAGVLRAEGDATAAASVSGIGSMRVHAFLGVDGVYLAVRLLGRGAPSLESLHLPVAIADLARRERGLLLFAGPTGSGKSSTMAACIDAMNEQRSQRIVTVEDPIEFVHVSKRSSICQRQIGRDARSFESALRGILRADPETIGIGELRDADSMRVALGAAETGHLVLATVHAGDAPQAIARIVDAFDGRAQVQVRTQLAHALVGVVCQRLVARSHASGRRAVVELLVASDGVRNLIRDGKNHHLRNAMLTGRQFGMQTMEAHLQELVARGEVDAREARCFGETAHDRAYPDIA